MSGWDDLQVELDAWAERSETAIMWWRDDDAVDSTPALDRLLALAEQCSAPVALAVIPGRLASGLARRMSAPRDSIGVVQHGFAHRNHAPAGEKRVELGADRPLAATCEELARGAARLAAAFGDLALPVLVPPWNRIAEEFVPKLPGIGFAGLSLYRARAAAFPTAGLVQANCHVDIVGWRPRPAFLGEAAALDLLLDHLQARRRGMADPAEPTGLLSHHLVHDEASWGFLRRLLTTLVRHPAVRLTCASEVFGCQGPSTSIAFDSRTA
jgi:hypothetical protein